MPRRATSVSFSFFVCVYIQHYYLPLASNVSFGVLLKRVFAAAVVFVAAILGAYTRGSFSLSLSHYV